MGMQLGHRESMVQKILFHQDYWLLHSRFLLLVSCSGILMELRNLYSSRRECWLLMFRAEPSLENCSLYLYLKGSVFPVRGS